METIEWPSKRIAYGGLLQPRAVTYNPETAAFLKDLNNESKMSIQQRQKDYFLRSSDKKPVNLHELYKRPVDPQKDALDVIPPRPRTPRMRSLSQIRESGAYVREKPPFRVSVDREKTKEHLQSIMAGYKHKGSNRVKVRLPAKRESLPEPPSRLEELMTEVKERVDWLNEMTALGQDKPHRAIIQQQIADKLRQIKSLKKPMETILQSYLRIDSAISLAEKLCPGPRLARAESWLHGLQEAHVDDTDVVQYDSDNDVTEKHSPTETKSIQQEDDSVGKMALELGVAIDPAMAAKHEDFLARMSSITIEAMRQTLRREIKMAAERRVTFLTTHVKYLQKLYALQDDILRSAFGNTYGSPLERQVEIELESARGARDAFGSAAESWRTAGALLKASAKAAIQAAQAWELLGASSSASERISLCMESRSTTVVGLAGIAAARDVLPSVEMPYVTPRQMAAVNHAALYMMTDMANIGRYKHTLRVLYSFRDNTANLTKWVHETYRTTLQKDLLDAEKLVSDIGIKLRSERARLIKDIAVE